MRRVAGADALLTPVLDPLRRSLAALALDPPAEVRLGSVGGAPGDRFAWEGEVLVLDGALAGPGSHHPDEARWAGTEEGIDRWRRAMASVLEAVVRRSLRAEGAVGPDWLVAGLALDAVDRVAPELGVVRPAARRAEGLDLAAEPRGGVVVVPALAALGLADADALREAARAGKVSARWWCEAGRWVVDGGLRGLLGRPVQLPPAVDIPASLGPWSWRRLEVPPNQRGGHIAVEGGGGVAPAWARADTVHHALAGALGAGCALRPELGGPVGAWRLRTASGWGQVFGARGLTYLFRPSGRFEVVLADAFIGTTRDVAEAENVGTSGTLVGRWTVAGPRKVALHDLTPQGVSVHGRSDDASGFPAPTVGLAAVLQDLSGTTWSWSLSEGQLTLDGAVQDMPVTVFLAPDPAVGT